MCLISRLTVLADTAGFPGFVKCFEVEKIESPGKHAADSSVPESLGVTDSALSCTEGDSAN